MRVSLQNLRGVVAENVAEIKFARRNPKPGAPADRRMLCTNNLSLLNSVKGKYTLKYKAPTTVPKYNPSAKNLLVVWDIFMQGYRTVNLDNCNLISVIPANDDFWDYFSDKLANMTPDEKMVFMSV